MTRPEKRFQHITLLFPHPAADLPEGFDPDSPHKKLVLSSATRTGFIRTVERNRGVSVISLDSWPTTVEESLEDAELHDGAVFIVLQVEPDPLEEMVKELIEWRDDLLIGQEHACRERAVQRVHELGDKHVAAVCRKTLFAADGTYVELDGAAVGERLAVIVEAEVELTSDAAVKMLKKAEFIGAHVLPEFEGKEVKKALCGNTFTADARDKSVLMELCRDHEIEIWLPNGANIGICDSLNASPAQHSPGLGSYDTSTGGGGGGSGGGGSSGGGGTVAAVAAGSASGTAFRPGQQPLLFGPARLARASPCMPPRRRSPLQQGAALGHNAARGACRFLAP